jgi:ATP-dependent RNA helicase DHX36
VGVFFVDSNQVQREVLPAFVAQERVIAAVRENQCVVISGETGCGKTTQLPQIILDDAIRRNEGAFVNIVCTQPRRISAIGVADRVAAERLEAVGDTVGYQIRLESARSANTKLLFCTTGVLLRRLQCDPGLKGVSHVFVDEIHERDLNTDFLLIVLRRLLRKRRDLKCVLMSATLNAVGRVVLFPFHSLPH